MKSITEKLKMFKNNPKDVKFSELCKVWISVLETRDNRAQATEYIKPLGQKIPELTSKIPKEKPIKSSKS